MWKTNPALSPLPWYIMHPSARRASAVLLPWTLDLFLLTSRSPLLLPALKHIGTFDKSYLMQTWIPQETIAARICRKFRKTADMDTNHHNDCSPPCHQSVTQVHRWCSRVVSVTHQLFDTRKLSQAALESTSCTSIMRTSLFFTSSSSSSPRHLRRHAMVHTSGPRFKIDPLQKCTDDEYLLHLTATRSSS